MPDTAAQSLCPRCKGGMDENAQAAPDAFSVARGMKELMRTGTVDCPAVKAMGAMTVLMDVDAQGRISAKPAGIVVRVKLNHRA